MTEGTIKLSKSKSIATLTLNRPDKMNALRFVEMQQIIDYISELDNDPNISIIRIKSEGSRAFLGGLDLGMVGELTPEDIPKLLNFGNSIVKTMIRCKKTIVTQIQGAAVGWGCIISMCSDFVFAGENPKTFFSLPEIDIGLFPATGALTLAQMYFGTRKAKQILMYAKRIYLQEAKESSIITKIVPLDELEEKTLEFCETLTNKTENLLHTIKLLLNHNQFKDLDYLFEKEYNVTAALFDDNIDLEEYYKNFWEEMNKI